MHDRHARTHQARGEGRSAGGPARSGRRARCALVLLLSLLLLVVVVVVVVVVAAAVVVVVVVVVAVVVSVVCIIVNTDARTNTDDEYQC